MKALLALLLALFLAVPAEAQDFPELTGRVVDQANLLSPAEEASLTAKLEALEANSTRQLVVATVSSLQDYPIEDYGYQLGRAWGIGQAEDGDAEKDNGVLLIVAPNERKVRIEVGYGLEPVLTDALSSRIIQDDILPRFRDDDYPGGIEAGVDAIATQLTLPEDEARAIAEQAREAQSNDDGGDIFIALFWIAIIVFIVLPALFGKKGRRYGGGPVIVWGPGSGDSWGGGSSGSSDWGSGGGFSGGGGSFGGGGAAGGW